MHPNRALFAFLCILPITPSVTAAELEPLAWLAGCWVNPRGDVGSGEYWQPLAGGSMLGVGRIIRNGKTVEYEFLRLHKDNQGQVVYTATPSRQSETAFIARYIDSNGATFENATHDFPQKITYTKTGDASMVVRIEGERQGKNRAVDFQFNREPCSK